MTSARGSASQAVSQQELIEDIQNTLTHTDKWLTGILGTLQWTEEHLLQGQDKAPCSINRNHYIPETRQEKHAKLCPLLEKGYTKQELNEEAEGSSRFFYENSSAVIPIDLDEKTIHAVLSKFASQGGPQDLPPRELPATGPRLRETLSLSQRLCLHDYSVEVAKRVGCQARLTIEDCQLLEDKSKEDQGKSQLELKAEERDMKRRRQSYKKKSVHTGKKGYVEVIREVIELQTSLLKDKWDAEERIVTRLAAADRSRSVQRSERGEEDKSEDVSRRGSKKKRARRHRSSSSESKEGDRKSRKKHKSKHKKHKRNKHSDSDA